MSSSVSSEHNHEHDLHIPHRGSLCRIHMNIDNSDTSISYNQPTSFIYAINIITEFIDNDDNAPNKRINNSDAKKCQYQLQFHPEHYKFMEDIFTILDFDNRGYITKTQLEDFVLLRCPVFKKRDAILKIFRKEEEVGGCDSGVVMDRNEEGEEKAQEQHEVHISGSHNQQSLQETLASEGQDEEDIYKCILGEDFQSADDYDNMFFDDDDDDEEEEEEEEGQCESVGSTNHDDDSKCILREKNEKILNKNHTIMRSQTFEEIWDAMINCSIDDENTNRRRSPSFIGIEAWMVFCRFISLAQYQDAKRWFSLKHLQQDTPHNSTTGNSNKPKSPIIDATSSDSNEVVLVDVPTPERPIPISAQHLIEHELMTLNSESNSQPVGNVGISLPELDLDHSHLFIHDNATHERKQVVNISVFGNNVAAPSFSSSSENLEFVIKIRSTPTPEKIEQKHSDPLNLSATSSDESILRRSYGDMSWLHDTFKSQKKLGGTLCGRIIPPFPSPLISSRSSHYDEENISKSSTSVSVASASAVMVSSAAKSAKRLLGHLSLSSSNSTKNANTKKSSLSADRMPSTLLGQSGAIKNNYASFREKILDNPESKSKQLERYVNYMLDHPAMSTSFPLNVILKASQSGVESAKRIIENKTRPNRDLNQVIHSGSATDAKRTLEKYAGNLSWVRTAAQAALALQLHGVLETTGYQSASAKLQHASLPKFSKIGMAFATEDNDEKTNSDQNKKKTVETNIDFEDGIVCVESNLDDDSQYDYHGNGGYDLLPSPLPLSERSALCAGSKDSSNLLTKNQVGVRYSDASTSFGADSMALGDVSVDRDIERLRDIIITVDKSLSRCLSSGLCVGAEGNDKIGNQINLLKAIGCGDNWCGRILNQKASLKGIEMLEMNRELSLSNTRSFISDISWNASLATSAVAAADEVHDAVKASRTASRAKKAAENAAMRAHQMSETASFATAEEAQQAQSYSSSLRGQAIHAAVVEYEALTAKRQAAMSLARDVKCWNVHRKKQLIRSCCEFIKQNRNVARESKRAWEGLRNGLLESSSISMIVNSSVHSLDDKTSRTPATQPLSQQNHAFSFKEDDEVATASSTNDESGTNTFFHSNMETEYVLQVQPSYMDIQKVTEREGTEQTQTPDSCDLTSCEALSSNSPDVESSFHDTFEESIENDMYDFQSQQHDDGMSNQSCNVEDQVEGSGSDDFPDDGMLKSASTRINLSTPESGFGSNNGRYIKKVGESNHESTSQGISIIDAGNEEVDGNDLYNTLATSVEDGMTNSMQSLVDGLMNWGGQWDQEEDSPLPDGMAASIVERGILDFQ